MPEIGFGHEITKLNVVSHLKISLENLREKNHVIKHTKKMEKSGKTLISCLMGKIPYSRVFPLFFHFFGMFDHMIFFSNFLG